MNKLFLTLLLIYAVYCNAEEKFKQLSCEVVDEEVIVIQFSDTHAKRRVVINQPENLLVLKGTTLKDYKWATELDTVKLFSIENGADLTVIFKNGKKFDFGEIEAGCIKILNKKLMGRVNVL